MLKKKYHEIMRWWHNPYQFNSFKSIMILIYKSLSWDCLNGFCDLYRSRITFIVLILNLVNFFGYSSSTHIPRTICFSCSVYSHSCTYTYLKVHRLSMVA